MLHPLQSLPGLAEPSRISNSSLTQSSGVLAPQRSVIGHCEQYYDLTCSRLGVVTSCPGHFKRWTSRAREATAALSTTSSRDDLS